MTNRGLIAWFSVGHFANDWPITALWLIVPAAGIAMDLSPAEVGLVFTISGVGGAIAYLPAGFLTDRVANQGRLLVATFWWVAVGYLLAAMAPDFWSLALLLAVAGMGDAAWHPIATGVLAQRMKERRAQVLGLHAIGGSVAEVLAPLVAGFLLAVLTWRETLALAVVPTVVVGLCFIRVARAIPPVERRVVSRQDLAALFNDWRRGDGLRIVAMICLYNMALLGLLSMIPLYLAEARGFGLGEAGVAFSAILVVGALAQPLVGRLSDIRGRRPVIVGGNLLAAGAGVVLVLEPPLWGLLGAMVLAVAALDAIRAAVLASVVDHSDHSEGTALGLAFALMDGIGAFGAVLAGIAAGVAWPAMFGLCAALAAAAALLGYRTTFRSDLAAVS